MYNIIYVMTQQTRDLETALMLAHGLGHCPNIKTTPAQHFVFAGDHVCTADIYLLLQIIGHFQLF